MLGYERELAADVVAALAIGHDDGDSLRPEPERVERRVRRIGFARGLVEHGELPR